MRTENLTFVALVVLAVAAPVLERRKLARAEWKA